MSTKSMAKVFIDEKMGQLLDNVYHLIKDYTGDKKEAEKIVKYLIKITIKIAIAYRNDQFDAEELRLTDEFKKKFHQMVMTIISFVEVDFTFDKHYLSKSLAENCALLQKLIARHSTDKTKGKLNHVFDFFGDTQFLEAVFTPDGKHRPLMAKITKQLDELMESGSL